MIDPDIIERGTHIQNTQYESNCTIVTTAMFETHTPRFTSTELIWVEVEEKLCCNIVIYMYCIV